MIHIRSCTIHGGDFVAIASFANPADAGAVRAEATRLGVKYGVPDDTRIEYGSTKHMPSEQAYERTIRFLGAAEAVKSKLGVA